MQLPRLPDIDCQAVKNFPVLLNTVISMARVVHEVRLALFLLLRLS